MTPSLVSGTASGATLAETLAPQIGAEIAESGRTADTLRRVFSEGRPIVFIGAAGIAIRALAPLLGDKRDEPPVIAVAEDGSAVIPLLGSHRGGNDLANRIGIALGVPAAVTTGSDVRFGIALDAPPDGWTLANPDDHKTVAKALLDGASARVDGAIPWLAESALPVSDSGSVTLSSTVEPVSGGPNHLVYHPHALAVGVGCERGCEPEELRTLVARCLSDAGLAGEAVGCVVSLDLKMDEPAVHDVAEDLGVAARFFTADRLEEETPRLATPSDLVFQEVGCHGVSEGAALAATGVDGRLLVQRPGPSGQRAQSQSHPDRSMRIRLACAGAAFLLSGSARDRKIGALQRPMR